MSLFFGINIALKGMMAQQAAMDVASHNIANANTEGYSRQRVNLETSMPISGITSAGQLGSGVTIAEITRVRDGFVDYQLRQETSTLEYYSTISDTLSKVETVFMEPSETGFNAEMENFWSNWQEVANSPGSSPVRTALKEASISLTDTLRQMRQQLTDINNDIQKQIELKTEDLNSLAERIANLNEQIVNVKITGQNPNDFLDSRDLLLDELSALGNITVTDLLDSGGKATGAIAVKIGDLTIVDGDGAHALAATDLNSSNIDDGALAGLLQVGGNSGESNTVAYYINSLDTLAVAIAKSINDLHATGTDLEGNAGGEYFVFKDADGNEIDLSTIDWDDPFAGGLNAGNIYVNPDIQADVSKIAAAYQDGIFLEGNGDIALQIASLKDVYMEYDAANQVLNNSGNGDITLGMFYQNMITSLGSATDAAEKMVKNQQALVDQTANRRESSQGVNTDEEMANIILFQHAFDASAQVISVMDEMLDTIINGMKA